MQPTHRESAERLRSLVASAAAHPSVVRDALRGVPPLDRDAWLDVVLGLDSIPDDGPELPRGCVPYLPCPVDALLRMVDQAEVQASDVFVDVGSGVGRAAAFVQLLTGATVLGIEIQPELVRASRELAARMPGVHLSVIEGDAAQRADVMASASIVFLYCPFSGARWEQLLDDLEAVAMKRPIRICSVDLPIVSRPWLTLVSEPSRDLAIYRSSGASPLA